MNSNKVCDFNINKKINILINNDYELSSLSSNNTSRPTSPKMETIIKKANFIYKKPMIKNKNNMIKKYILFLIKYKIITLFLILFFIIIPFFIYYIYHIHFLNYQIENNQNISANSRLFLCLF